MFIYKITNKITGKNYIGQTRNSVDSRWKSHHSSKRKYALGLAIQKYGKDSFSIDIIASYKILEDLNNAEIYYINFYNSISPNGYNLHSGGRTYYILEETRKRLSESHKGQIPSDYNKEQSRKALKGKPTWNSGKIGYTNKGSFKKGNKPTHPFKLGGVAPLKGRKKLIVNGKVTFPKVSI
jgi:group I intron endonuclease